MINKVLHLSGNIHENLKNEYWRLNMHNANRTSFAHFLYSIDSHIEDVLIMDYGFNISFVSEEAKTMFLLRWA